MIDKKGRSSLREENKNNWPKKSAKQDNKQRTQLMVLQTMTMIQALPRWGKGWDPTLFSQSTCRTR